MMNNSRKGTCLVAGFTVILLTISFINIMIAGVSSASEKVQRAKTFVGSDLHTLTFTNSGLFVTGHNAGSYSTDEGVNWKSITSLKNVDIMSWATTNLGFLAGGHNGLFKSTDGGRSFTRVKFYGNTSDVHSLGATNKIVYMGSPQVGFLRSIDSGKSWKVVNQKFGQEFMGSMLVDPTNPRRVIASDMSNGLVISTDSGKTWTRFGGPSAAMSVDWNGKNRKEIVALGMGIGALTKNAGKTWTTFSVPTGAAALALSSTGSRLFVAVLVGSRAEVFTSDNFGKTWV